MLFHRLTARLLITLALILLPTVGWTQSVPAETGKPASSVNDLIRILENDDARHALLARLKNEAAEQKAAEPTTADPTIARQIAEQTRAIAEQIVVGSEAILSGVAAVTLVVSGSSALDYGALQTLVLNVVLVGAGVFATFFILRILAHFLQKALDRWSAGRHWSVRSILMFVSLAADMMTVALAWGAGYLIALQVIGGATGRMDINQTLLLNAFLMVEMLKVVMRLMLQPRFPGLRLLPISDTTASYWYFWLARAVSMLVYTFMFAAPVIATNLSEAAAQAIRVVVMLTALVIAVIIILQNRDRVRYALSSRAVSGRADFFARSGAFLAGVWHLIAIAYLSAIFVVWLVNPAIALPFMIAATMKSIVAIMIGGLVIAFIGRFANAGLRLPDDVRARLPALEGRLQAFVPRVMHIIRIVVTMAVLVAIAQVWALIDFLGWLSSDTGQRFSGSVFAALIIFFSALSRISQCRPGSNIGSTRNLDQSRQAGKRRCCRFSETPSRLPSSCLC